MVKTLGNWGWEGLAEGPPTNSPLPSPELALILHSLEAINETLRGCQTTKVEVDHPPPGLGNLDGSWDSDRGPPIEEITRDIQNIKLPDFAGGRARKLAKALLEGTRRCFVLRDYTSNSKAKITIFQLRDNALNWWGNLEHQLHLRHSYLGVIWGEITEKIPTNILWRTTSRSLPLFGTWKSYGREIWC